MCSPWKKIPKTDGFVWDNCSFKVGMGDKTLFWKEKWRGEQPLNCAFPNLYRLSMGKGCSIKDLWKDSTWDLRFRRNLLNRELEEWDRLASLISNFNPSSREDFLFWRLDKAGMLSVNSVSVEIQSNRRTF